MKPRILSCSANGSLVIGQEQDRLGGGFSESEAFLGRLSLLDVWDVFLNESNVMKLWSTCEKYHGNLVAWAQLRQYIHGDIVVIIDKPQNPLSWI